MRKLTEKKIILASHNEGKLKEISDLLAPYEIEVVSAAALGLEEPAETEETFAGNARIKAHFAAKNGNMPALADDSGIMIDALDGQPGVHTADWAETENGRDFEMAMTKVTAMLDEKKVPQPRHTQFCCTLCIAWPDGHDEIFEGKVHGKVVWPMRGDKGFGFDPIFIAAGHEETFGEMEPEKKHRISHRALAFKEMKAVLED
ncbi:MAG: RdgB/HAM1 family non-canonical purine NTP pyrophosphatase [Pseudomonadota bacterium]